MLALALPLGIFVALLLVWFFFRKGGYKRTPLDAPPGRDWKFTGERFVDPQSGAMLEVWCLPRTGERVYVRDRSGGGLSKTLSSDN
jgi:hypothetical protein